MFVKIVISERNQNYELTVESFLELLIQYYSQNIIQFKMLHRNTDA